MGEVDIKIKLTAQDYLLLKEKVDQNEKFNFVPEDDAIGWIERNIVGNITKY
jgi:hypothetical protein